MSNDEITTQDTNSAQSKGNSSNEKVKEHFSAILPFQIIEKIVRPYYNGNLNVAIQDLINKTIAEQDFVLSHITHIRSGNNR
jgi:hypothetical protein